jgi:hypothetical protein
MLRTNTAEAYALGDFNCNPGNRAIESLIAGIYETLLCSTS